MMINNNNNDVGYIALFVPSHMNRQVENQINVGIFMAVYACTFSPTSHDPSRLGNLLQ